MGAEGKTTHGKRRKHEKSKIEREMMMMMRGIE
jgi:hypothetical protein